MIKTKWATAAAAALLGAPAALAQEGELLIYNWTDYLPEEVVAQFEDETGIDVTIDTYDSNETLLAKLQAGGTGYDIVVATSSWVPVFVEEGLIQPINLAEMPNFANVDPAWTDPEWDPGRVHSAPYQWGFTTFAVNTARYPGEADSLSVLFEPPPELQGQIGMLNSPSEVITLAQTYLDLPFCDTDVANLQRVQDLLQAQAPAVKVYNSDGQIERLVSGETAAQMGWNGNLLRARQANPDVRMVVPDEGVVAWADGVAIPTGAPNVENAKLFIDFILRPEIIAQVSNYTGFANNIPGSSEFLDAAMRDAPELNLPEGTKLRFLETCPEEATQLIDRIWTSIKE